MTNGLLVTIERVLRRELQADGWQLRQDRGGEWVAAHSMGRETVEIPVSELAVAVMKDVERFAQQ